MSFGNSGADDDFHMVTHHPSSHDSHNSHGSAWSEVGYNDNALNVFENIASRPFVPSDVKDSLFDRWTDRYKTERHNEKAQADFREYVRKIENKHMLIDRLRQQDVDHEAAFQDQYQRDLEEASYQVVSKPESYNSTSSYQMVNSRPASNASTSSYQMVSRPNSASQSHSSNGPRSNPMQELNNDHNAVFNPFRLNFPRFSFQ